MTNKDFDKIFQQKLSQHSTPVDGGVWSAIESSLDSRKAAPVGFWRYAVSAVALLIIALFVFKPEPINQLPIEKTEKSGVSELVAETASPSEDESQAPVLEPVMIAANESVELVAEAVAEPVAELVAEVAAEAVAELVAEVVAEAVAETVSEAEAVAETGAGEVQQVSVGANKKRVISYSLFSNIAAKNSITATSSHLGVMASSAVSYSNSAMRSMELISQAEHSLPLNLGIQAQVGLGKKMAVGIGLSYTMLKSRYEALLNKKFHNVKQTLHYIGIPVNFYFNFLESNYLKLYANAGGTIEKGVSAKYRLSSYDGTSFSAKANLEGLQYSANLGLGLEYAFSELCGVYLEPNAVYFFDSRVPASIRTDQPFQLKAEIGFRFHW